VSWIDDNDSEIAEAEGQYPSGESNDSGFFESNLWIDASRKLCADGWPHVVILVNQEARRLQSKIERLEIENKGLRFELQTLLDQLKHISDTTPVRRGDWE